MTKFFHASKKKLKGRYNRRIFIVNILPAAVTLTLCGVVWINRNSYMPIIYYLTVIRILTCAVGYSFITILIGSLISSKKLKYHTIHTYVEILNKDLIVSSYKEAKGCGKRAVAIKKLWVIRLAEIEDIYYYNKNIIVVAPTRLFLENADWLTYTGDRFGVKFDNWWYDYNGDKLVGGVEIRDMFSSTKRIARTIQNASGIMQAKTAERRIFRERMLKIAERNK